VQTRKRASAPRASKRGARRAAHAHCTQIARDARTYAPQRRARGREGGRAPSNGDITGRPLPPFATDRFARCAWLVSGAHLARGSAPPRPPLPLLWWCRARSSRAPRIHAPPLHSWTTAEAFKTRLPFSPLTWESDGRARHAFADYPWAGPRSRFTRCPPSPFQLAPPSYGATTEADGDEWAISAALARVHANADTLLLPRGREQSRTRGAARACKQRAQLRCGQASRPRSTFARARRACLHTRLQADGFLSAQLFLTLTPSHSRAWTRRGLGPGPPRMLSGCGTTTPHAHLIFSHPRTYHAGPSMFFVLLVQQ